MDQSNEKPTASSQEPGPETDTQFALYERLLAEKDNRISELTTALNHERGKHRSGIWPDLRAGFIGYLLGLPLGLVKLLATQAFITHTASMMALLFLAIYFSLVVAFVFFMGRKVYRNWKAARQVSLEVSYVVQLFYSIVLSFAITMEIITGPDGFNAGLAGAKWFLLASLGAIGYNYWRVKACTERTGKPLPGLPQIGAWLNLR